MRGRCISTSLTSTYSETLRQERAYNYSRSAALYELVCAANDHVMRLIHEHATAQEIRRWIHCQR